METSDLPYATAPVLEVMICTHGADGIRRVAASSHPAVDGVGYLVSWQTDGMTPLPAELERRDFRIVRTPTKGLSANRNSALVNATAPLLLISDDDADYTEDGLRTVIEAFSRHPEADIITFRYASASSPRNYPPQSFPLSNPPKGYFVSSIEIAMRRKAVAGKVWFNENFGIGATFPSGEEDIFLRDCLDLGLNGIYVPATITRHDGPTTSERNLMLPSRPQTKGAVFLRLHPADWPMRMIAHAIREIPLWRKGVAPSPISYCSNWLKGVCMARRMKAFPTPDLSSKYLRHD